MDDLPDERVTAYLDPELINLDLRPGDKECALKELLEAMQRRGVIEDADVLLQEYLKREAIMSTGIGNGLAIPHIHTYLVDEYRVAIGYCRQGVEFDSLDGTPVYLIIMIAAVEDTSRKHVRLVSSLMRLLSQPGILDSLKAARRPQEVIGILQAAEMA